jgi:tetratricopeptide (TPR) repeat protein
MDLERKIHLIPIALKPYAALALFLSFWVIAGIAQTQGSRPPALIRDTATAEGKESTDEAGPKELNPLLAEENLNIGNFYYKKRNYPAAIQRYREALEYKPDFIRAYESLAQAYEKNKELDKAMNTYKDFIEKYPESPKSRDFRARLSKLEQKTQ